ncbi:hypothetical protein C8T65DRAFT_678906 [Cerioporus squamosus]|nr:hypothetical protein C8T65DRAFT_678906 [Cerioporus squamosus]
MWCSYCSSTHRKASRRTRSAQLALRFGLPHTRSRASLSAPRTEVEQHLRPRRARSLWCV